MKTLSIDIETYSPESLAKCGVYRYCQAPEFEVLLFGYSVDSGPVQVVDLAAGERIPADVLAALTDPAVSKWAFNAQFERVCLSRYLGYPVGRYLDPDSWYCTMVWSATLGLPLSLEGVGAVLGLEKQKLKEGKDLVRYFCTPAKAKDGSAFRRLPTDAPEKWISFKAYNLRDVETEMSIQQKLSRFPVSPEEWDNYHLDQRINDRGVRLDRLLVKNAMAVDQAFSERAFQRAKALTGLENPGSVSQLKAWLADMDMPMESLSKRIVQEKTAEADGIVKELLELRLELSRTSVKKYESMARCICRDGRVHGLLQFGGAARTFRWAGRLVQAQNLPQNHLPDLSLARDIVRSGDEEQLELLFGSVPGTLSQLIRTAFIPKDGCHFIVADFSAIEARVLAWLAGEEWVLEEFRGKGKIYEATASRMFHIPQETIVRGHPNYEYRQKGKQATLSCGYGGGVGALKAMGAKMPEEEMQPLVDAWRAANPHIVRLWNALGNAASEVIEKHDSVRVGKVTVYRKEGHLLIRLPGGRDLCYLSPRFVTNRFGSRGIGYLAPAGNGQMTLQETFGGKLAENCTQSIARDLLAHAMQNLEAAGYPIVFHVHDEAVMEVPVGQGGVEEVCRIMAIPPKWAQDLPLRADGEEMEFYRK